MSKLNKPKRAGWGAPVRPEQLPVGVFVGEPPKKRPAWGPQVCDIKEGVVVRRGWGTPVRKSSRLESLVSHHMSSSSSSSYLHHTNASSPLPLV